MRRCLSLLALFVLVACENRGRVSVEAPDAGTKTSTKTARGQVLPELKFGDGPIARVNGVEIPRKAFETYYNRFRTSMHRYPVLYPVGGPEAVMARVTKRLVTEEIIRQQAKLAGVTPPEEKVKAALDQVNARIQRDPDYAEYHRQLGTTPETFRAEAEVDVLREEMVAHALKGATDVPESELKTEYEARKEEWRHPDQIHLGRIRMDISAQMSSDQIAQLRERAKAVRAAISKGSKFEEAAKTFSDGTSRDVGGDLGWLPAGAVTPTIAATLWRMKPGTVSGVLEDERGIYIFKVHGFRKAGIAPLADVRNQLIMELKQRRQADALNKVLFGWKDSSKVEILVPELQAALTRTATALPEIPDRDPSVQPGPKSMH